VERLERLARFVRANVVGVIAGLVLLALASVAVRWIARNRETPPPRKVMQFTMVNIDKPPPPPPKAPPPPPPPQPQKVEEPRDEPQANRVELKSVDIPPPDAPPPAPSGGGQLALAAEGEGPGDAFNLAGNPGGRGLLSGGGLGDGNGAGVGAGADSSARFAWYYARIQPDIEAVLKRSKKLAASSVVVELRIWWDPTGRITRVQPVGSSAHPAIADEFKALVGLQLRQAPPPEVPVPVIMRIRALRPN
jgi:outer membrane biosynthesis protein TonB